MKFRKRDKVLYLYLKKRRINVEQLADFVGMILTGAFVLGAFIFFFGFCWGGFLR